MGWLSLYWLDAGLPPPVIDGVSDCGGGQVAATHLVFGNFATRVGYRLVGDAIGSLDRLAQDHFGGHRGIGNGDRASHALEPGFLDEAVFDTHGAQYGVTGGRTFYQSLAGGVGDGADVARMGVMGADLFAIHGI